jgi:hypothetical protein
MIASTPFFLALFVKLLGLPNFIPLAFSVDNPLFVLLEINSLSHCATEPKMPRVSS